jgi:hypothetical protein
LTIEEKRRVTSEEKRMNTDVNIAKQVVHDELESQIKTVEAKLNTSEARAETAKANLEIKAIAALLPKTQVIRQKVQERITEFEKSVNGPESKAKAS